jgi:hypothetical protein
MRVTTVAYSTYIIEEPCCHFLFQQTTFARELAWYPVEENRGWSFRYLVWVFLLKSITEESRKENNRERHVMLHNTDRWRSKNRWKRIRATDVNWMDRRYWLKPEENSVLSFRPIPYLVSCVVPFHKTAQICTLSTRTRFLPRAPLLEIFTRANINVKTF